ncbi:MAG: hypothetical protein NT118_15580 [Lentisphaerae bacterium]|nr:hypothetical protein [Lentisphaerota bacterium]
MERCLGPTYRDWEDIDEALRFDDFLATCERGDAVMPADKPETCDEYIQCDGPYYADGFVYYDDIPAADTYVA